MEPAAQARAEYLNYGLAALGVFFVAMFYRFRKRGREKRYAGWLATPSGAAQGGTV